MTDAPEITAAREEAARCRTRLIATAEELQERLSPKRLTRDAWQGAKDKGADIAENAVDAVRARPIATGGVLAAITLFLAREPLMDLAAKITDGFTAKRATKKHPNASSKTKKHTETRT